MRRITGREEERIAVGSHSEGEREREGDIGMNVNWCKSSKRRNGKQGNSHRPSTGIFSIAGLVEGDTQTHPFIHLKFFKYITSFFFLIGGSGGPRTILQYNGQ